MLIDESSLHREVLPNGLTVIVRRDTSAPVVAIVTYVKAGYFDETDDVVGIAHVLEHMYFKGTPTRGVGAISKETKAAGGYLNAGTIYDHTSYYTVLPASSFIAGLEVQADAYANSVIDAEELARELEVIIQEAKRKSDNPQAVATETLYELLHDRHRIRRWRIGREPELRELRREHVLRFYRNFYRPSNTVLVVVGDVDPAVAMQQVTRLYGSLPTGEPERTLGPEESDAPGFRHRELSGDIAQSQLVIGWRAPGTLDPVTPHLDLLAAILGTGRASRLYRAVRERSLASSVTAYNYTPTDLGVFVLHAESQPVNAAGALQAMWDQIRTIREEGIGALELERAKRVLEARWLRRLEDMEGQANHLAEWEALGDWSLGDRYLERLMTSTPADVAKAARDWLDPDNASVLVYRPEPSTAVATDAVGMRELLERQRPEALASSPPHVAVASRDRAGVTLERQQDGVHVFRTTDGLPVLVRSKPGARIAYVGVQFLGGGSDENEVNAGSTSLMSRAAVKGTVRRSAAQIAEEGELLGGSIAPLVSGDSFGWSVSVPLQHLAAAASLLGDVTQEPTFPDDAVETERTAAIAGVVSLRDDMYRYPMRLVTRAAFQGHPYGVPVAGTEESLRSITADDLRAWHRARVHGGSAMLAVVADGDPAELAATVARAFDSLQTRDVQPLAPPRWPSQMQSLSEQRQKAQTALAIAFPSPSRTDDERFAAMLTAVIASGLGGRFFDELREKRSLAYTVQAFQSERSLAGSFISYIATSPDQEEEARAGLLAEFTKLREAQVGEDELQRAQRYAIGVHAIRQQSGGALLADMMDAWMFGDLTDLALHDSRVQSVTTKGIQALAQRYFDPDVRVEGIVRGVKHSA